MWITEPYFARVTVCEVLFLVSVGYLGWVWSGALFCVGEGWGIILGRWEWLGHCFE